MGTKSRDSILSYSNRHSAAKAAAAGDAAPPAACAAGR
jgi:hypothetical protein